MGFVIDRIFLKLGFFLLCLAVILAVFSATDGSYLFIDKSAYVKYQTQSTVSASKAFS